MSTTTTLVDYTDTQMLDEAMDGDFSMQNSPADWLAVEATMSDDNPTSAATDYSEANKLAIKERSNFFLVSGYR